MGKAAHKKFMRKERAKVKLKSTTSKTLLPKGQNVTDLNFKVKKIVIKNQLKEHEENEVLSSRKLNIQEVLSRLNHYSGSVATEAVGQLDTIIKSGGTGLLKNHLTTVISQLAKLLTSSYSHLRKAAVKQLSSILSQVDESEWLVIKGMVVSYIVCGLSHVDTAVRADSLRALDSVPSSALSVELLLPSLLDVLSTSSPGGNRSLSAHISSSPTAHRASVLARINSVLSSLQPSSTSVGSDDDKTEIYWKDGVSMRVPLTPSYPLHDPLSVSEFTSTVQTNQQINLQEFASSLVPLMMDSFVEIVPEPDDHEPVTYLSQDGMKLLGTLADVMLLLQELMTNSIPSFGSWMKDKFGNVFYKRIIEKRFPYSVLVTKKGKTAKDTEPISDVKINLTLALLALKLNQQSQWKSILHYFSELLRNSEGIQEKELLQRCLSICLSQSSIKSCRNLISSLVSVKRCSSFYEEAFTVLSNQYLSNQNLSDKKDCPPLNVWMNTLIEELSSPDEPLHRDSIDFLKKAAPMMCLDTFNMAFTSILEKAMKSEDEDLLYQVSSLIYWLTDCEPSLTDLLTELIQSHTCGKNIKTHIIHLLVYKCERYPDAEVTMKLKNHSYWNRIIPLSIT